MAGVSPERLIVTCDTVAFLGFAAAFIAAALMPVRGLGAHSAHRIRIILLAALGVYVFTAFSNTLEHGGIAAALDPYEDYVEILAFPLIAYALHAARVAVEAFRREQAEESLANEHALLSTVMRISPVGAMIVDSDGRIILASEAARELLALRELDDGTFGHGAGVRLVPMPPAQQSEIELSALGKGVKTTGVLCAADVGDRHPVLWVCSAPIPPSREDGAVSPATLVLVQDVTEREIARQELVDAQSRYAEALEHAVDARTAELLRINDELRAAVDAKQRLLANISHELKTPLNVVIGFSDVLAGGFAGPLSEEQMKQVGMIREAGRQLLELVEELLEAHRLESSEPVIAAELVDVASLARSTVEMLAQFATAKGLGLCVEAPEHLEVTTDRRLVAQVLRNLISNAVKFTHDGSITVSVDDADDRFRIVVVDTGVGIPETALPRIFEPFVQVHGSNGEKPEGTGLGLSICRQITEALGGTVAVESRVGAGSIFTVELPKSAGAGAASVSSPQEA